MSLPLALLSVAPASGCSMVLDDSAAQCSADTDCDRFGAHPTCQAGVCVDSGLGPKDCYFGTPKTQDQFANQCSTALTFPFDNCERLGLCDDSLLATAFATTKQPDIRGPSGGPIDPQPPPVVSCADASAAGKIIYMTGSTNLPPLLQAVQKLLDKDPVPYVAVYAPQTSCKGAASIYDADPKAHQIFNTLNNYAFYYKNVAGTYVQTFCSLDPAGNTVDLGESDVYPSSCGYAPNNTVNDYPGPVQAIAFVVPSGSSQTAISAEAAHLVFSMGGDSGRAFPWTDPLLYFVRSSGTGTVQLPSLAIGLQPTAWWGLDRLSAGNLVRSMEVISPAAVENAIGILSSDFADRNRSNIRELAFQQRGRHLGYLPDSKPTSFDKANVRDGHYPIWGAIHFLAPIQSGDTLPSPAAQAIIMQFNVAKADEELVGAIIDAGFIPPCAMKVKHSAELGALSINEPSYGCGCYFENRVNNATTCKTCSGPAECPASTPACNYGYCETVPALSR